MRTLGGIFLAATFFLASSAVATAAQPPDQGDTPGLGWGKGGDQVVGTPGPVVGIGLPLLAAAGGLIWVLGCKRPAPRLEDN